MTRDVLYVLFGYFSGSILFARVFGKLLKKKDITQGTADCNPGTTNAFRNGGFWCGILTLCADLLKGFVPVFFYLKGHSTSALPLIIAAPVIGHICPFFYHFAGGKGIATTFGCLLGLAPDITPVALLIFFFVLFSTVIRIYPHFHRTLCAYACVEITLLFLSKNHYIILGFSLIFLFVAIRMLTSKEQQEPFEVKLLWMH